jgi:hypothetical protein
MDKDARRLQRQFDSVGRTVPPARRAIGWLTEPGARLLRIPAAVLLILGSFLFFLPGFGIWMLPLGLMLLALDVAILRGPVAAVWIRLRRRLRRWRARRG